LYRWKAKYGGMRVGDAQRLKQLEDENRRLKKMVANLSWSAGVLGQAPSETGERFFEGQFLRRDPTKADEDR
jgi:putative transposase